MPEGISMDVFENFIASFCILQTNKNIGEKYASRETKFWNVMATLSNKVVCRVHFIESYESSSKWNEDKYVSWQEHGIT